MKRNQKRKVKRGKRYNYYPDLGNCDKVPGFEEVTLTWSSIECGCHSGGGVGRVSGGRQAFQARRGGGIRLVTIRVLWLCVAAVALAVVDVDVVVIVVVAVLVAARLCSAVWLVSSSSGFERVLPLAVDAVEQKLWDGLPRDERVVICHLATETKKNCHLSRLSTLNFIPLCVLRNPS